MDEDEDVPPRVLEAEKRRAARQEQEDRVTPLDRALVKMGVIAMHIPDAEPLTKEEEAMIEAHLTELGRDLGVSFDDPHRNPRKNRKR